MLPTPPNPPSKNIERAITHLEEALALSKEFEKEEGDIEKASDEDFRKTMSKIAKANDLIRSALIKNYRMLASLSTKRGDFNSAFHFYSRALHTANPTGKKVVDEKKNGALVLKTRLVLQKIKFDPERNITYRNHLNDCSYCRRAYTYLSENRPG